MLLLQSRGALQDGLSIVLGSSQEPESPQAQVGIGGGAEFETKNSEAPSAELPTKTVKAVTQVSSAMEAKTMISLEINYERAAAEAINKKETRPSHEGNRATIETGDRNAEVERDVKWVSAKARSRSGSDKKWKLQHSENGDGKANRNNEDWSQDNVNNHR